MGQAKDYFGEIELEDGVFLEGIGGETKYVGNYQEFTDFNLSIDVGKKDGKYIDFLIVEFTRDAWNELPEQQNFEIVQLPKGYTDDEAIALISKHAKKIEETITDFAEGYESQGFN